MSETNTNWEKSVTGVVIRDGKVLLARHTYGAGKGRLIIPGGYIQHGESPESAVVREILEETGITVEPGGVIGIRFNMHDWYIAFRAEYVSGEAHSDGDENSEVLWLETDKALISEEVPDLSKQLIRAALSGCEMPPTAFSSSERHAPQSLYCFNQQGEKT
ncbi:MAG: NUDIX domain-containing protein [Oscillospiraceae bacterium]